MPDTDKGTFSPFRYPAYRAIWTANLVSNTGSMIQTVAAAWLMAGLTHSHQWVAMVQTSSVAPVLVLGIISGAIADNYDRRRVMIWAQLGMLIVSAVLAVVTLRGDISPWLLLAMTMGVGACTAMNQPAWQASVRMQVPRDEVPQAVSLNAVSFNVARCLGPAMGGLLLTMAHVGWAFALNALSFVGLLWVLLRWRPDAPPRVRRPMLPAMAEGLRYCAGSQPIRRVLGRGLTMGFGIIAFQALLPMIVREGLHGTEVSFGVALGLFGIGSVLAGLVVTPLRRKWGSRWAVSFATLAFVLGLMLMALAPGWGGLGLAAAASLIAGMGWIVGMTTLNIVMQSHAREDILGRCMSLYQSVTFGAMALGSWAWGLVADWVGAVQALQVAALYLLVGLVVMRWWCPVPDSHRPPARTG
ncbi:MFS transporter [Novosphingobium sp. FSY-8]|uniref:MFS transporter n=1 Tax=Novosphingobium ovatum TaxID=1908523 RepID=A0ABW9XEM7_9SPHN|nr:MFS transporter [Novosphingobium ovatum]